MQEKEIHNFCFDHRRENGEKSSQVYEEVRSQNRVDSAYNLLFIRFASSGQLKKTIDARRKHQQIRKKNSSKKSAQDARAKQKPAVSREGDDDEEENEPSSSKPATKG
jgi:curved DNA-binding protein CbpA